MALSQIQCLDDNHVNPRTHESKPDFFYCEDQRLALEALLQDGREAFVKYLESRRLRGFLSDPELESLSGAVEPFDPDSELFLGTVEDDQTLLSLHYWPELSDTSVPQLDLGWPDSDSYRGVTRTSVYTQPPLDGQAHIKEVVRKMIVQAQKVIAVVMDVFTDVDIFRDLLDAGFKRKVSVYILLERTALPHFLSMCHRASMHAGHLKHLRVCCSQGAEFYTRFCTKVRGRMGHRFMFIDGDKAVSGSYSFTWMSSRLDRNLITVTTGQAVDAFDQLFRFLYMTSSCVNLQQVAMEPEPEPDLRPHVPTVAPPSADVARKLFNPKYALVALTNPSPTTSIGHNISKEPEIIETSKNKRRKKAREEAEQEALPLHPGLTNLEKACLTTYLPTWPEPDPPSDVIGFINIRDANKPTQVHLQRSEMFETSQAIRFSSPISRPQETLPEVAKPRQRAAKHEEENTLQLEQSQPKAERVVEARAKPVQHSVAPDDIKSKDNAPEQKSPPCPLNSEPSEDKTTALKTESKLFSNTNTNPDAGHNTAYPNAYTFPQSSCKAPTPLHTTQTISTNSPKSNSHPESNCKKEAETVTSLNIHTLESNSTQTSQQPGPVDSNTDDTQKKTLMSHRDSQTKPVNMQPDISSEMTHNLKTPSIHRHISTASAMQSESSTFLSKNNLITTVHSSTATSSCTSVPSTSSLSILPSPVSSVTALSTPLPSSSPSASSFLTSGPPIPKLRTVHLVFRDSCISNNQMLPEICLVRRPKTSSEPEMVLSEVAVATTVPASPAKEPESSPELQINSASKTEDQKYTGNTNNPKETSPQKQNGTSQETEGKEANGQHDGRAGAQSVTGTKLQTQSDVFTPDTPKTACLNVKEITPKDADSKTLTSDTETASAAIAQASIKNSEKNPNKDFAEVLNVIQNQTHLARAHGPQRVSHSKLTPKNIDLLEAMDPFKAPVQHKSQMPCTSIDSTDDGVHMSVADKLGQLGKQISFISGHSTNSMLNTANHNIDGTVQEQTYKTHGVTHAPKMSLRLQVSHPNMSDSCSPTSERESRSLTVAVRTPSPDGFTQHPPTPDSQTTTPDPRSYIPDFLTPTSDISDGYISPREDSTTSEEYYECSESPFYEPVFDLCGYQNRGTTENYISFTHSSTPTSTTTATNPAYLKYAATLLSADQDTSCSETQTLSCTSGLSVSSLIGTKGQKRETEDTSEDFGGEEDIKAEKLSHTKKRTERESQGIERAGSDEASRMVEHFKQEDYSTETAAKGSEAQAPKRKRGQNQSAPDRLFDGGVTAGESTCQETESKEFSTGDFKPKTVSSERAKPDKASPAREKAQNQAALRPSNVEMTESQSTRETKGHKQLQQQDFGLSTRPLKSPRTLSASQLLRGRSSESRELNQTESKLLLSSLKGLDNVSSPRKPPSRQSPPVMVGVVGSAAGRKQISRSQQSLPSQHPPAAQIRARAGQPQSQSPYPKPQPSFLHTYSNLQPQVHPHTPTQTESTQEGHEQGQARVPFNLTFSRLYSIKGSKEKMSKLPAQSKRSSPPARGRKSSS